MNLNPAMKDGSMPGYRSYAFQFLCSFMTLEIAHLNEGGVPYSILPGPEHIPLDHSQLPHD